MAHQFALGVSNRDLDRHQIGINSQRVLGRSSVIGKDASRSLLVLRLLALCRSKEQACDTDQNHQEADLSCGPQVRCRRE